MSLKSIPIWVCFNHSDFFLQNKKTSPSFTNHRVHLPKLRKWECLGLKLAQLEKYQIDVEDDEKPDLGSTDTDATSHDTQITDSKGFHKDLNSLPSKLTYIVQDCLDIGQLDFFF